MNISLICSCKNRNHSLQISLSSWLLFKEITEIIIVDWDSDESLNYLTNLDSRIKIIAVSDQQYFNQPQPLNLAVSIASGDYILKVDTDYILNPYFNFFEYYKVDNHSFLCGQNDYQELEINSSPYFKYLRGLLFVSRENYLKVGGYNEVHTQYYAYEDDEIVHRLELLGLEKKKVCYNHHIIHIPHPDKKRVENFQAYHTDKKLEENIRKMLSTHYSGEELEWQVEYVLAQQHIEINRQKSLSEITDYYFKSNIIWKITQINEQLYMAKKHMPNEKLKNLSKVYYISLEESKDRQDNIISQFSDYNIEPYGIISKRFKDSNDKISGKYLHQLNDGTKGCCVSHLKAIKHWYENHNDEYGFFCEDDLSLETVQYWDFTWEQFINNLPKDWDVVQLLTIRENFDTFKLRERYWNDWSVTAYILKRDYAKRLIENYIKDDTYCLEIPNSDIMPLIENIVFTSLGKCYTIPLFVENINFNSTHSPETDSDVKNGQKTNHYHANETVLNYWKNKFIEKNTMIDQQDLQQLLTDYSLDTENAVKNFNLGLWYENNRHTAPALSYYLRCAERSDDLDLAYEALIRGSYCYEKQGTRDETSKSLLQQALCLLPNRPEAYFLLSRFFERRQWWQDCYIYANWGLQFADFNLKPLRTDVEYPGYYGLLFEKAVSGWWWGKDIESKNIFIDLYENYELDEIYKNSVNDNLNRIGVDVDSLNQQKTLIEHYWENDEIFEENWFNYPNLYKTMVERFPSQSKFVEVGSWKGRSSAFLAVEIANSNKKIDFYCVDTWEGSGEHKGIEELPLLYDIFLKNMNPVENYYTPLRMTSYEASKFFENQSLDFVFLDASHEYEDVKKDIINWIPKIKPGGILAGHDYGCPNFEGVKRAVDEELKNFEVDNTCYIYQVTGNEKTKNISDLFKLNQYNTDKYDLGYLDNFYDNVLEKYRNLPITILEIGVYRGGSIKLWKDYFHPETQIYAADINYFDHIPGTYSIIGDAYSKDQISKISDDYFDLIIDDGPHSFDSFVILMQRYFSKLKKDGILIIEDIIVSSWVEPLIELSQSLGYSSCEVIDMTGKQKTQELIDHWGNGLYILKITK
jgi:predicted O-methyltransferase YrrM